MLHPVDRAPSASGVIRLLAPSRDAHGGPEHHTEVVGRHCRYVLQRYAVRGGYFGDRLKIANAPVRVAGPKLPVERRIARCRVPGVTPERAVEDQHACGREETRGA